MAARPAEHPDRPVIAGHRGHRGPDRLVVGRVGEDLVGHRRRILVGAPAIPVQRVPPAVGIRPAWSRLEGVTDARPTDDRSLAGEARRGRPAEPLALAPLGGHLVEHDHRGRRDTRGHVGVLVANQARVEVLGVGLVGWRRRLDRDRVVLVVVATIVGHGQPGDVAARSVVRVNRVLDVRRRPVTELPRPRGRIAGRRVAERDGGTVDLERVAGDRGRDRVGCGDRDHQGEAQDRCEQSGPHDRAMAGRVRGGLHGHPYLSPGRLGRAP